MKKWRMGVLLGIVFLTHQVQGQVLPVASIKTHIYSIKDQDTLKLDVYTNPAADTANRPCLLYVFGGGFIAGRRNDSLAVAFAKKMVSLGFDVVAMDYRLGFRKAFGDPRDTEHFKANLKKYKPTQFLDLLYGSINIAVEDLMDATKYIVANAGTLHLNPHKIIPIGSSAGAITVLQAENNISNRTPLSVAHLPENFNYAGVISMAGAIFSMKGDVKWGNEIAPILMFHGDADRQVPYDKARIKILFFPLKFGFYGSKHIAQQLQKAKSSYWFFSAENAGHELSYRPMLDNVNEIMGFYKDFVLAGKPLEINTDKKDLSKPNVKKKFGFTDYVKGNFGK